MSKSIELVPTLDPKNVPAGLRHLIPLAQEWGISDDNYRDTKVHDAHAADLEGLVAAVSLQESALYAWLAGPEADCSNFTDEYIAFSALGMAYDFAKAILDVD